jgi:uncharacterized secreted protein with C-terminal beta-propeller domain
MKTFDERMASIREKSALEKKKVRNRRILVSAVASALALALALTLFMPYSTALPDVSMYADSPYYDVIQGLNKATYEPPKYKNNFAMLAASLASMDRVLTNGAEKPGAPMDAPLGAQASPMPGGDMNPNYEDVTDNQVAGVIEADLFKRSDKHIYYLQGGVLYVYSIDKSDSMLISTYNIRMDTEVSQFHGMEMFLSRDCATITILMEGFHKELGALTAALSIDVSDPAAIKQSGFLCFTGSYISSRMVGDDILLTYNYGFYSKDIDFDRPETFVPQYGTPDNMFLMDSEDIICPGELSSCRYTVVAKLAVKGLELRDTVALMSYSQELYVSADTIFATHGFTQKTELGGGVYRTEAMTEITGISYVGDELEILGSVQLKGNVRDQYSMDQHEDILRIAASTTTREYEQYTDALTTGAMTRTVQRNCSLYCVDLTSWQVAASVEAFAPNGDEVTSARFDGDKAYICTAEVIVFTDPVYFFDLSDLSDITWTDTGIIDGYSSSLINFGDYLLGIGFSGERGLKLEAYVQGIAGVESTGIYERLCEYPSSYKSYYIDRENHLVGIPVQDWEEWERGNAFYLLLHFDGYKFREVKCLPLHDYRGLVTRATVIDGWLYVFCGPEFIVEQVY